MLPKSGELTLKVNFVVDEETGQVQIFHTDLNGALTFRFTSLKLAQLQLASLDISPSPKTTFEEISTDFGTIVESAAEIKELISQIRNGNG